MKATRMMMLVGMLMSPSSGWAQVQAAPVTQSTVAMTPEAANAAAQQEMTKECSWSGFAGADWVRFVRSGLQAFSDKQEKVSMTTLPLTSLGVSY
jgi:hypothetical protein